MRTPRLDGNSQAISARLKQSGCLLSLAEESILSPSSCIPDTPPLSLQYAFDYHPESEVFACVADIGWITGHSYVVYGPLCNGGTTVLFEGHPTYPDPGIVTEQLGRWGGGGGGTTVLCM